MRHTARPTRENRTITVDFQNEATYFQLLGDGKAFVEFVVAFLLSLGFQLAHKASCGGGGGVPPPPLPLYACPAGWSHHLATPIEFIPIMVYLRLSRFMVYCASHHRRY